MAVRLTSAVLLLQFAIFASARVWISPVRWAEKTEPHSNEKSIRQFPEIPDSQNVIVRVANAAPKIAAKIDVTGLNTFLISDQVRISVKSQRGVKAFMDKVDDAWQAAVGNQADYVQVVLYRDDRSGAGSGETHDLGFVVIILTRQSSIDERSYRANYDRLKPTGPMVLPSSSSTSYSFLVMKDTISDSSIGQARDLLTSNLRSLWNEALGKDVRTIIITFPDGITTTPAGQLTYLSLVIAKRQLNQKDTDAQFHSYLVKKSLSCSIKTERL